MEVSSSSPSLFLSHSLPSQRHSIPPSMIMGQWNSSSASSSLNINNYQHESSSAIHDTQTDNPAFAPKCFSSEFLRGWKDPLTDLRPALSTPTNFPNSSNIIDDDDAEINRRRRGFPPVRRHRITNSAQSLRSAIGLRPSTSSELPINENTLADASRRHAPQIRNGVTQHSKSAPVSIRSDSDESMEEISSTNNRRKKDRGLRLDHITGWKNESKLRNKATGQRQTYVTYKALLEQRGAIDPKGSSTTAAAARHMEECRRRAEEEATAVVCERRLLDYQHKSLGLAKKRTSRMALRTSEHMKAKDILNSTEPTKIITEKFNIEISPRVLSCLAPMEWCNDEVINFYMNLLQERNDKHVKVGEPVPKTFCWSTFFYTKLTGEDETGNQQNYSFKNVNRWTTRKKIDLFTYDLILVPVHVRKIHWTLGAVDMKNRRIYFFDSMNGSAGVEFYVNILQYLKDEHLDKKGVPLPKEDEWIFDEAETYPYVPQQSNGSDCGVFVCQFCECLSDGRPLDFTQDDIPNMRLKMISQICAGEIK